MRRRRPSLRQKVGGAVDVCATTPGNSDQTPSSPSNSPLPAAEDGMEHELDQIDAASELMVDHPRACSAVGGVR